MGAGAGLAKDASSAYITTDTECDEPIDLQVNEVADAQDAYVWLKLGSTDIEDLAYKLYQGGELITGGAFDEICSTTDGKYTLAYLLAAHEEFEAQYAAGRPIDRRGLRLID